MQIVFFGEICMKGLSLISEKNKKNLISLVSVEFAQRMVTVLKQDN